MDAIPLVTSSTVIGLENFWTSISVYYERPHVVNRKLAGASSVLFCEISLHCPRIKHIYEIFTWEALIYEFRKLEDFSKINPEFLKSITQNYDKEAVIQETTWDTFNKAVDGKFVSLRILFPRKGQEKCVEIVVFDKSKRVVTFFAIQEQDPHFIAPRFPYHIELSQTGNIRILVNKFEDADTPSAEWLVEKLFPKILKWAENDSYDDTILKSLTLISAHEYCFLYADLKSKYTKNLLQHWQLKTKTDPQKYVFEDVAIAAYLICLWRKVGAQNVNFVDCGCGNGLLVYILNKEGFKGCGFDIRKRKVWELFSEADLRLGMITPDSNFPEATWIIGNHSDELTPWIPVIALNSSIKTNYFVLPCCPYDFSGNKYSRLNTGLSQYADYLEYVKKISNICGFDTSVDKLRIPSTRRTCLIGIRNDPDESKINDIKKKISDFIGERSKTEFTPRNPIETVRNCTHLNKDLISRIINLIVKELLETKCLLTRSSDGKSWNQGGTRNLSELCNKINAEDKQSLKNECGGLQTLLKNHRYIFNVDRGTVSLRKPQSLQECSKYKSKPCWFFKNHPDGCCFESQDCSYKH